jgi:hypothetical protein
MYNRSVGVKSISISSESETCYDGEVVGFKGKIGTYILHSLNCRSKHDQYRRAYATPRGVSPGLWSKQDSPIFACIPSSSIKDVWDGTVPHRRKDIVFLSNCVPSHHLRFLSDEEINQQVTIAVMHFGASKQQSNPIVHCFPETSPPTILYGRHASNLAALLGHDGIPVIIAKSSQELQAAAVRKLAWSSFMWLLCHDVECNELPLTVKDIHVNHSDKLQKLVEETIPLLKSLGSEKWSIKEDSGAELTWSVQDMLEYIKRYSMSISNGNVTPSRDLALTEIYDRNGLILSLMEEDQLDTSYHVELLRRVVGDDLTSQLTKTKLSLH